MKGKVKDDGSGGGGGCEFLEKAEIVGKIKSRVGKTFGIKSNEAKSHKNNSAEGFSNLEKDVEKEKR